MLVEITGSCGHTAERELKNRRNPDKEPTTRQVNNDVKFWSTQNCSDCYLGDISNKLEQFGTLPELVGSEKQVSWAARIRQAQLLKAKEHMETLWSYVPNLSSSLEPEEFAKAITNLERFDERAKLLASVTDAKFWIDTREEDERVLLGLTDQARGFNYQVKYDLETGDVVLASRAKTAQVVMAPNRYNSYGKTITVGGKLFHDRTVNVKVGA